MPLLFFEKRVDRSTSEPIHSQRLISKDVTRFADYTGTQAMTAQEDWD